MTRPAVLAQLARAIKAAALYLLGSRAVKSVDGYVNAYVVAITEVVTDLFNGDAVRVDVGGVMRRLIASEAEGAYIQGMIESGEFENESEAEDALTDSDREIISTWQAEQKEHVKQFTLDAEEAARALADGSPNTEAQAAILARIDLWGLSLRDLASAGKMNALVNAKDPYVTWRYGDTDHCETCQMLNGKRERLSWFVEQGYIPQENASETLDCRGYNCQCELVNDRGKRVLPA